MEFYETMEAAKTELAAITGLEPVAVVQAFKDDAGTHVHVDMLEMSRIPEATDVLGEYEVLFSEDGNIAKFQRRRTRLRGEPMEEEMVA